MKKPSLKVIALVAGISVVLCIVCGRPPAYPGAMPTPSQAPAAVAAVTVSPIVADTATTVVLPSPIPRDTRTPTVTAIPSATATPTWAALPPAAVEPINASNADRMERMYTLTRSEQSQWMPSPDGRFVANRDARTNEVTLYDSQTGSARYHLERVDYLTFSPDSKLAAFVSADGAQLMDLGSGAMQAMVEHHAWSSLLFAPNSQLVVMEEIDGPSSGALVIWDIKAGAVHASVPLGVHYDIFEVSPDSTLLASWTDPNTVTLTALGTGAPRAVINRDQLTAEKDGIGDLLFSPDGKLLALRAKDQIVLWGVESSTVQAVLKGRAQYGPSFSDEYALDRQRMFGILQTLAFSPDGRWLATANDDRTVQVWDVRAGALKVTLDGHASAVGRVAFSPDSSLLVSAVSGPGGSVQLWSLPAGTLLMTDQGPSAGPLANRPRAFAFSRDSALLAVASQFIPSKPGATGGGGSPGIRLWNTRAGTLVASLSAYVNDRQNMLVFGPDSRMLVHTQDGDESSGPVLGSGRMSVFGLIPVPANRAGVQIAGDWPDTFKVPSQWFAIEPVPARYKIVFTDELKALITCQYTGANRIDYTAEIVTVTVIDLKTNTPIGSRTFRGNETVPQCPPSAQFAPGGHAVRLETNKASPDNFVQWLGTLIGAEVVSTAES